MYAERFRKGCWRWGGRGRGLLNEIPGAQFTSGCIFFLIVLCAKNEFAVTVASVNGENCFFKKKIFLFCTPWYVGTRGPTAAADCEKRKGLFAADLRTRFASGLFTNPPTHIHTCAAFWANIILKRKRTTGLYYFQSTAGTVKTYFILYTPLSLCVELSVHRDHC